MIHYVEGDLLESDAMAFVNAVNLVGVMGKGIALQFKIQFPKNFKLYKKACKEQHLQIGNLLITEDNSLLCGKKTIINFPTKKDWKRPSEYHYIEAGLQALVAAIQTHNIHSIAIPALGVGNGGLDWEKVKVLLESYLSPVDCEIFIYLPHLT